MTQYKNLLIVYSGDLAKNRRWFERMLSRAKQQDARLRLLALDRVLTAGLRYELLSRFAPDLKDIAARQRTVELRRTLARIRRRGVTAYGAFGQGNPVKAIVWEAKAHRSDLILLLSGDGHDASKIAAELLRVSPVPVIIQEPRRLRQTPRVLAAVKVDEERGAMTGMNRAILSNAAAIARAEDAELHVAAAWTIPGEATMASPRLAIPKEQVREIGSRIRAETAAAVDALLEEFELGGLRHRVHVIKGTPDSALADLTSQLKPGLIVMGSRSRTRLGRLVFGNTTARMADMTARPILSVRAPATEAGLAA